MDCLEKDTYASAYCIEPEQFFSDVVNILIIMPNPEPKPCQTRNQNLAKCGSVYYNQNRS